MQRRLPKSISILPIVFVILGIVLIIIGVLSLLQSRSAASQPTATAPSQAAGGEPSYPEIQRVSLEDAKKAYDEGSAVFVDVRSTTVYADSHIPGALNIPLAETAERLDELNPNDWIITYCT